MPDDHGFYLAGPSGPERAGVLVVHDWYGLLPHVRAACDELAAAGLVALALDLYDGRTATDPAQAEALMEGLDQAAARARLDEAVATVRARAGGGPVGVLGWSMGGRSQVWPGTEHSFANGDVALHAPDAAAEAWAITVRFLRDRLAGAASG